MNTSFFHFKTLATRFSQHLIFQLVKLQLKLGFLQGFKCLEKFEDALNLINLNIVVHGPFLHILPCPACLPHLFAAELQKDYCHYSSSYTVGKRTPPAWTVSQIFNYWSITLQKQEKLISTSPKIIWQKSHDPYWYYTALPADVIQVL